MEITLVTRQEPMECLSLMYKYIYMWNLSLMYKYLYMWNTFYSVGKETMCTKSKIYITWHYSRYVTVLSYIIGWFGLWCWRHFQQYFKYIGGGNQSTRIKSPTCRKLLTNFITYYCIEYISAWTRFEHTTLVVIDIDCTHNCKSIRSRRSLNARVRIMGSYRHN